jgi:hypothetical protein
MSRTLPHRGSYVVGLTQNQLLGSTENPPQKIKCPVPTKIDKYVSDKVSVMQIGCQRIMGKRSSNNF